MSFQFWWRWLMVVTGGVIVYSLSLIFFPMIMQDLFNTIFFLSPDAAENFSEEANNYITLVHGVLGAVLIGWMLTFLSILNGAFHQGHRSAWNTLTLSLTVWYLIDSGFSLYIGVVAHAIFNTLFLILFAIPLAATSRQFQAEAS